MSSKDIIPAPSAVVAKYSNSVDELLANIARNYASRFAPELATPEGQTRFLEALRGVVRAPAIGNGPSLADCAFSNPESLCDVVSTALGLGLDLHPSRGEIYLIPRSMKVRDDKGGKPEFRPTVTMIIGYKGLVKAAKAGGHVIDVWARMKFPGEVFEIQEGTDPRIHHIPNPFAPGRTYANCDGVYAVALRPDAPPAFEVFNREQVEKRRAMAAPGGAWSKWEEEMALKAPLRRLITSRGWLSTGLAKLLKMEDEAEEVLRLSTPPMPRALPRQPGPSMLAAETAREIEQPFEVEAEPMPADVASAATWAAYDTARGVDPADRKKESPPHARNSAAKLRDFLQKFRGADGQPLRRRELHDAVQRAADKVAGVDEMVKRLGVKEWGDLGDDALLGFGAALVRVRAEGEAK